MRWYETCCIVHLPSRQYLAVEAQGSSYKVRVQATRSGVESERTHWIVYY